MKIINNRNFLPKASRNHGGICNVYTVKSGRGAR